MQILSNSCTVHRLVAAATILLLSDQALATCYVDASAAGHNNGSSWADAYTNLQLALIDPTCTEARVAKGVYKPTLVIADPAISFNIPAGMKVYGGFAGDGTDSRDPFANPTVLSGDIDNNDAHSGDDQIDRTSNDIFGTNSYHVVMMDGTSGSPIGFSTILDGFVITGGNADGPTPDAIDQSGGGLFCNGDSAGAVCSPALSNLRFSGNTAGFGGAVEIYGGSGGVSSPVFEKVIFSGNSSVEGGGAISTDAVYGEASPTFKNVVFMSNTARGGAATSLQVSGGKSNPTFSQVTFVANSAEIAGTIYSVVGSGESNPTFVNVTFAGNSITSASGAGAVVDSILGDSTTMTMQFRNVTFSGNASTHLGGAVSTVADASVGAIAHVLFSNVIAWNNSFAAGGAEIYNDGTGSDARIDFSVVDDGCSANSTCSNVTTADPLLDRIGNNGGFVPTMRPKAASSAIDAGNNSTCPTIDERGLSRADGKCDIGAVELQPVEDVIFADGLESF